ncbi:hypothetical protein ODJ79_26410 [Actinoplanes sp. KI2]|uniref:hypothetical protein n=1 Tax=Actinoplanes sp. KI2 TaxID=2983315 RepID=UPI0021D5905C|nr:hypothetical protein [Actinoplanes sp. KI2]MCU7727278.1 hypothetical protein [Actinoplanes sp. KI2]
MISGFEATTSVIISIWVVIGFLLLPTGSLRYWTAAFVVLLAVVGVGDHLPVRTLLVALLALHVLFVAPAAARSGQRALLRMALISLALLTALVVTGGVRYWLPALIVGVLVVPFGVPLLWARPRPAVEVRLWPRLRGPERSTPVADEPAPAPPPAEPGESPADEERPPRPAPSPPPPRNVRQFPPGKRRGARPSAPDMPQRQRRPPAAS